MKYHLVIVGGGPAGTGVCFKALKDQKLDSVADLGVAIIEKSSNLMLGSLTDYKVNSDTYSGVFLECLEGYAGKRLGTPRVNIEVEQIAKYDGRSIPLPKLNRYFAQLGNQIENIVSDHPNCDVFTSSIVTRIDQNDDASFSISVLKSNETITIKANHVLIATGGQPSMKSNFKWSPNHNLSLKEFSDKTIHSDALLRGELDKRHDIDINENSHVVILGGGHSGFSCAHYLLNNHTDVGFDKHDIKIFSNAKAKIYFQSEQEALEHNYTDFDANDFCPVTKRLYRLAGLRMDGRELYMSMLGMTKDHFEDRVQFNYNMPDEKDFKKKLEEASLIVQALGYTFNMPAVYNSEGDLLSFSGEKTKRWVDQDCRLLDSNSQSIPNFYAYGLASGFVPSGKLGGESSFNGQTNGLWYYQNILADIIIKQVFENEITGAGYVPTIEDRENKV